MITRKHISWTAALIVVMAIVAIGAEQLFGQATAQVVGDFRNAATAEVVDAQGQPVLRGSFAPVDADDKGEVERLATLSAVHAGSGAKGEAEVEFQTDNPNEQEIELNATGLAPNTSVSLIIDGNSVLTATADAKGRVEVETVARSAGGR